MFLNHKLLGFILLFICSLTAVALSIDSNEPVHIVADSSIFDYKTGMHIYTGNVKVQQGSTKLIADKIVTKNNAQHKIEEAIAYGTKQPAVYSTIPKQGDSVFQAKAKIIKFYPATQIIVLEENVTVKQGENSFQGQMIIYNMKDQTVSAPALKGGRATIVIDPKQFKS